MLQGFHIDSVGIATILLSLIGFAVLGCGNQSTDRWRLSDFFSDTRVQALADAAGKGDINEIDRLVAEGVDINTAGKDGMTPLLWTLWHGSHGGFERLLEHGADPNRQHSNVDIGHGRSVTTIAACCPTDSFWLEAVLKHGGETNLVESEGDINHPNSVMFPIHRAVDSRRVENLDLLIRAGADLNSKASSFGSTPLIYAATTVWYQGVFRLLEAGADYTIKDDSGGSLADYAIDEPRPFTPEVRYWKDKVLDFLENKGVDLEAARIKAAAKGMRTTKWTDEEWAKAMQGKGWPIPKGDSKPRPQL